MSGPPDDKTAQGTCETYHQRQSAEQGTDEKHDRKGYEARSEMSVTDELRGVTSVTDILL